jgi:hypothetical protein
VLHASGNGLVNNAGGQYRAPLKDIKTKGFDEGRHPAPRREHLGV